MSVATETLCPYCERARPLVIQLDGKPFCCLDCGHHAEASYRAGVAEALEVAYQRRIMNGMMPHFTERPQPEATTTEPLLPMTEPDALLESVKAGDTPAVVLADRLEEQGLPADVVRWLAGEYDRLRAIVGETPAGSLVLTAVIDRGMVKCRVSRDDGTALQRWSQHHNTSYRWVAAPDGDMSISPTVALTEIALYTTTSTQADREVSRAHAAAFVAERQAEGSGSDWDNE